MSERIRVGDFVNWPEAPNQFRKNKGGKVVKIKKGIGYIKTYWDDRLREVPVKLLIKL